MPGSDRSVWGANVGTADGSNFTAGIGGWSVGDQASACVQSTDQAHSETHSLKITRNATSPGTYMIVTSTDFPVAASTTYYFWAWFYTAQSAAVIHFDFDYYTSGQAYISSLAPAVANTTLIQNDWKQLGPITFTTPATTAFVRPIPVHSSGLSNGNTVYMDDLFMGRLLVPKNQLVMPQAVSRAALF